MNKVRRSLLLSRIWFWATVHSPDFQQCQFYLHPAFFKCSIRWLKWGDEFLVIRMGFSRRQWRIDMPLSIYQSFAAEHKQLSEIIDNLLTLDDIPF